jgi:uncharacterized membrane protein YraQ (UPF0718 family)
MLLDSGALLLLGLTLAGVVRLVLNDRNVSRFLGGNSRWSVLKAAAIGVPLPLCSCSVLPVTHQLRKAGVGKGPAVSFLVSTPESGIDSIMLTYSLMDPIMTVARPVIAFTTAITAGLWETAFDTGPGELGTAAVACSHGCSCTADQPLAVYVPWWRRLWQSLRYAFTVLIGDLAVYLLIGYALAGVVGAIWGSGDNPLPEAIRSGWAAYLGAVVIGLPLYICATSSTPLAAALVTAGFSPGAALVFLIVGPATNLASLVVVRSFLEGWAIFRYLLVVVVVAVLGGIVVDLIYHWTGKPATFSGQAWHDTEPSLVATMAAGLLTFLILWHTVRRFWRR